MVLLRGSGSVLILLPSSSLNDLKCLDVGSPGAFATAAILGTADVDMDFEETGLVDLGGLLGEVDEEKDRKCWKDRCAVGWLSDVQPAT